MKNIQLILIWSDGKSKQATQINSYVINDNLKDSATFYYALLSDKNEQLAQGNITMIGEDYEGFITNEYAYEFIATKLGLTLI